MPISPEKFRHTLGHLPSGVTVLIVKDRAGQAHGMTVSAATSLSLVPPMVLVCIDHQAAIHDIVVAAEVIGLNVLAREQEATAVRFADRDRHAWTEPASDTGPSGLPMLPGALARLEVRRTGVLEGGDHSIVIGTVEWSDTHSGMPLLYFRSRYTGLSP